MSFLNEQPTHMSGTRKKKQEALLKWAQGFQQRFSSFFDPLLTRSLYAFFGAVSQEFFEQRDLFFLKRLVLTQYFLRKKMDQKKTSVVRVLGLKSRACLALCFPRLGHMPLKEDILTLVSQKMTPLIEVGASFYEIVSATPSAYFFYLELEKMRGKTPSTKEFKKLEQFLRKKIKGYCIRSGVFWPYNHEESFKQLIILSKEVASTKDLPQLSIHFQKQTDTRVTFSVYLARPKRGAPKKTFIHAEQFPPTVNFTPLVREQIHEKLICMAEAFSLSFPVGEFRVNGSVNLLLARERVATLLQNVLGAFRDYNGGLFESQKKAFKSLTDKFESTIPYFSLFAEELFYSLNPVDAQLTLSDACWEEIFRGFSQAIVSNHPVAEQVTQQVYIVKQKTRHTTTPLVERAKKLLKQQKILAYLEMDFLSDRYFCMVADPLLSQKLFTSGMATRKKRLTLSFEEGILLSLDPYYLELELRGKTVSKMLYEGLTRINPKGEPVYAGCINITAIDSHSYLVTLKRNYWSNGDLVTAFDYELAWKERVLNEGDITALSILKNAYAIKDREKKVETLGVRAIDQSTLRIDLQRPDSYFLRKLATAIFTPVTRQKVAQKEFNGPYCVHFQRQNTIVLRKNNYYHLRDKVHFDEINLNFDIPPSLVRQQFEAGKIDWAGPPCTFCLKPFEPMKNKELPYPFLLELNTKQGILTSRLVRQALSLSVSRKYITQKIFPQHTPLYSPLPAALSSLKEGIKENTKQAVQFFQEGLKTLRLNRKNIPLLKLSLCDMLYFVDLGNYLKQTWEETFGINVELDISKWNRFYQKFWAKDYQMCALFDFVLASDKTVFLERVSRLGYNLWKNNSYEEQMALIRQAKSDEEKEQAAAKAETILLEEAPFIPLFNLNVSYAHRPTLHHYAIDNDGSVDFAFSRNKPT